jgi:AraC-like DNA-binding protein
MMNQTNLYYHQVEPNPILAEFVQCYWVVKSNSQILPTPDHGVIPGGYVDIAFNVGEQVYTSDSGRIFFDKAKGFVAGPLDRFQRFHAKGHLKILGVRFHLGSCPFFPSLTLKELRNRAVPLDKVLKNQGLGAEIQALELCLADMSDTRQQISFVERFLMKALGAHREPDAVLIQAIGLIKESKGRISIDSLSSALRISGRQLERKFDQHVGLSPKAFCRVTRFRQAKFLLENNRTRTGSNLAYACGYYDQTHLIHEFRSFTGQTPARYERVKRVEFFLYNR